MKDSEAFEQQIHRIHELLEGSGAEVTWNDHIPDPDNPSQPRQIDVTIRRDGKLTLVECRHRQSPQDVTWIEELMGRHVSLGAGTTIAVSSSGFTTSALQKARRYGIITRDLHELTDLEIHAWRGQVALKLYYYQYSDLELSLCFRRGSIPRLNNDVVKSELTSSTAMQSLFNAAAQQLGTVNLVGEDHTGQTAEFSIRLQLAGFQLSGESVIEVEFRGNARLIPRKPSWRLPLRMGRPATPCGSLRLRLSPWVKRQSFMMPVGFQPFLIYQKYRCSPSANFGFSGWRDTTRRTMRRSNS